LHASRASLRVSLKERWHMLMSCPFCGAGTDLPHETQEACIAALHSEISRIRQMVERLNAPAFVEASARLTPNDISGDNPNPQPGRDNHG
jgi:hypothetical protein